MLQAEAEMDAMAALVKERRASTIVEVAPRVVLTPRAVTMSPGHPFPLIPQFVMTFGVIVQDVRNDLHGHSMALSMKYYVRNSTGNMMSRMTET